MSTVLTIRFPIDLTNDDCDVPIGDALVRFVNDLLVAENANEAPFWEAHSGTLGDGDGTEVGEWHIAEKDANPEEKLTEIRRILAFKGTAPTEKMAEIKELLK